MGYREFNFDGLVGPTHNYAGLSYGNVASDRNRASPSNPRRAALQGLEKAKALADRGFPQGIFPPHERPAVDMLRAWGFTESSDGDLLRRVAREAPHLLAAVSSASAMWTANACTMAASCDSRDKRVHLTPANLYGNLHRSIEAPFTERMLRAIFSDPARFTVHPPLTGGEAMADEGAANHTRLSADVSSRGLHLFVYGRSALDKSLPAPARFPARQTLESVQAIARLHSLPPEQSLFIQQSPEAVDAGVFHNDVIAVGSGGLFLCHEKAFADGADSVRQVKEAFQRLHSREAHIIEVPSASVSLEEAVQTYLFNSQLMRDIDGTYVLVTPQECRESESVSNLLKQWSSDPENPIRDILSFDLRESMRNGGGPACLRQRVLLSDEEASSLTGRVLLDGTLYQDLRCWVEKHYRESLHPDDLADPCLLEETRTALDELTGILRLPSLYPFQK